MSVKRDSNPALFFSKKEKERIVSAVREAELQTSGEIRVHLERQFRGDALKHAEEIFQKLNMDRTEARNGVLILMGLKSKRFFILGDIGIHEKVGQDFWDAIVGEIVPYFKEDRFADGLAEGILEIGKKLKNHFPYQRDDVNELPDEISFSL